MTPQDRELKSNDSNEFEKLEEHVDASLSQIMQRELENKDEDFEFDKS